MPGGTPRVVPVADRNFHKTVTIANGASLSDAEDLGGFTLVGVITDSAWDTNSMSFLSATTLDGTYLPVKSLTTGSEFTAPGIAASGWYGADPADFASVRYLKVRSGTSAAAVNQSGDTVVTLVLRGV